MEKQMAVHKGGCVCGALSWQTESDPLGVTFCHCQFCQRATGTAYFVEPFFKADAFSITTGSPTIYNHISAGSGKIVSIHFCGICGSKSHLSFERFPDVVGVYAGGFDDPNWFKIDSMNSKHIFLDAARTGTIIPPGIPTYQQHATRNDGTPCPAIVFEDCHQIPRGD
jgi:hypothetical protein